MIKNILLLQYFFRSHDIPFVYFFFEALRRPELPEALSTPATERLYEEIDLELLVPIGPDNMLDRSADRGHPGPRSQEASGRGGLAEISRPLSIAPELASSDR